MLLNITIIVLAFFFSAFVLYHIWGPGHVEDEKLKDRILESLFWPFGCIHNWIEMAETEDEAMFCVIVTTCAVPLTALLIASAIIWATVKAIFAGAVM